MDGSDLRAPPPHGEASRPSARGRCRTNSRHGLTDPADRSYPPVKSVSRALDVLLALNRLRIASVTAIHEETGFPKSTIVRMLETLRAEGYVARDNLCGGYRVTSRVQKLNAGYPGISQLIEVARPLAIELTHRLKWPIGIGVIDGDAIAIKFWTGTISPWSHTNTVLGLRPDLVTTAMGRAYLAYCPTEERDRHLKHLREDPARGRLESRQCQAGERDIAGSEVALAPAAREPHGKGAWRRKAGPGEADVELVSDVVRAIDHAVAADLNVHHLIGSDVGHAEFGIVVLVLGVGFCPRHRNDVDRSFFGAGHALLSFHRVSPKVSVIVTLENHIDMILVEERRPGFAELLVVARRTGRINRMMEGYEFPGGFGF